MSVFDHAWPKTIDGAAFPAETLRGKPLLITNVASAWGVTESSYAAFRELNARFAARGLVIVAFPCNQFGAQEPKPNAEVKKFAESKGFKGELLEKVDVIGADASPVWTFLQDGQPVKWNFEKFVIGRDGKVVRRFLTKEGIDREGNPTPELIEAIDKACAA